MTPDERDAANDLAEVLRRTRAVLKTVLHDTQDDLPGLGRSKTISRRLNEIREVLDAAEQFGIKATDETQKKTYALPRTIW